MKDYEKNEDYEEEEEEAEDIIFRELFLDLLSKIPPDTNDYVYMYNPKVVKRFREVSKTVKQIFKGKDALLEIKFARTSGDFSTVNVLAKDFDFNKEESSLLRSVIAKSDSFEVAPRTDNKVEMCLGVKGLIVRQKIEEESL